MKIYFAGSISGGRDDAKLYEQIILLLKDYGSVSTEHVGHNDIAKSGEFDLPPKAVHDRDMGWLLSSNLLVAEITTPSLGVGYEIGRAIEHNINVICLYRRINGKRISPMIIGANITKLIKYKALEDLSRSLKTNLL